mmetsp:Transcript_23593/g.74110  ORF Transcript_23593/g.74110 Transcript_23593/m.74110 type:complete len:123 (+) Transcript_23593:618-986(+)
MKAAADAALPGDFADAPLGASTCEALGLGSDGTLRSLVNGLTKELEDDLLETIEDRREGADAVNELVDEAATAGEKSVFRRRLKYYAMQALAVGTGNLFSPVSASTASMLRRAFGNGERLRL